MKKLLLALVTIACSATVCVAALAAETHSDKETKEDIAKHRAMAAAHEAAANCLESGKKEDVCNKALQAACKRLAIGQFCGRRSGR